MPTNKKSRDRIACLLRLMKENRYPNHTILEKEMRKFDMAGAYTISRKTVQRDVAWLKENYDAPIQYDPSQKGYYLANPYWEKYVPFLEEEEMDAAIQRICADNHMSAEDLKPYFDNGFLTVVRQQMLRDKATEVVRRSARITQ